MRRFYGDEALRSAADALRTSCRIGDTPCRLGGDEFAVILPGATAETAEIVAARAQARLREVSRGQYSFSGGGSPFLPLRGGSGCSGMPGATAAA